MQENGNTTTLGHADPTQVAAGVAAQAGELAPTAGMARAMAEVQSAVILAKQFPRDTAASWQELVRSCKRPAFANDARYSFRRGGGLISGPTVKMAREAARIWGNFRSGFYVANDDEATGTRTVIGWAWDLQTNYYREESVRFRRLVQRKQADGTTAWVEPDERDARELTGRQGAVAERNAILRVLPSDYVADAEAEALSTLADKMAADPDAELKKLLKGFDGLNVTASMLETYVGHPLKICSPAELVELRDTYRSIRDGETTPADVFGNGDVLGAAAADTLSSLGADGPDVGDGEGAVAGAPPAGAPASPPPAPDNDTADLGDPSSLRIEEIRDLDRDSLLSILDERAKGLGLVDAVAKVRRYISAQYQVRNIGGVDDDGLRWCITNWPNLVETWKAEQEAADGAEGETNGAPADPEQASQDAEADAANGNGTLPGVGS